MIDRYSRPEMKKIWSDENKYDKWLKVELAACEAWTQLGKIPEDDMSKLRVATYNMKRLNEILNVTKHDMTAFLKSITESIGPEGRWIHKGLTTSDVWDTATSLQLLEAGNLLNTEIDKMLGILKTKAVEYKKTIMMGRTHGVHAEPITYGLKNALWKEEISRNIIRWKNALLNISVGQISGAVGTYQHLDPEIEIDVCKKLGLTAETVSNQVISRDRHAEYLVSLALIATTIEKISIEIRHLQKTEVLEVEEYFLKGQKGSSAMPHKRNPIVTERMTGFARLLRSNAMAALENVALWHERDISHSSVERIIIPDSTTLMDYMLNKMIYLLENLYVYPDNMMKNINLTNGLIFSQEVLLALIKKGISREESYELVQKNAMQAWDKKISFKELLFKDNNIMKHLSKSEVDELFNLDKILININKIYKRIGIK